MADIHSTEMSQKFEAERNKQKKSHQRMRALTVALFITTAIALCFIPGVTAPGYFLAGALSLPAAFAIGITGIGILLAAAIISLASFFVAKTIFSRFVNFNNRDMQRDDDSDRSSLLETRNEIINSCSAGNESDTQSCFAVAPIENSLSGMKEKQVKERLKSLLHVSKQELVFTNFADACEYLQHLTTVYSEKPRIATPKYAIFSLSTTTEKIHKFTKGSPLTDDHVEKTYTAALTNDHPEAVEKTCKYLNSKIDCCGLLSGTYKLETAYLFDLSKNDFGSNDHQEFDFTETSKHRP